MRKRTATIEQDETIYECISPYATGAIDGDYTVSFGRGQKMSAASGYPLRQPTMWIKFGSDHREILRKQQQLHDFAAPTVDHDKPAPPVPMVRCTKAFSATATAFRDQPTVPGPMGLGGSVTTTSGVIVMNVGDVLPAGHPVVTRNPDNFERIK